MTALTSCIDSSKSSQNPLMGGEKLFRQTVIGGNAGCTTCHSLEGGVILIGPSLAGIGTTAAQRIPGKSAEDYIKDSILNPDAIVIEGFPSGVMPGSYADSLSEDEVNQIVAYLLTLNEAGE